MSKGKSTIQVKVEVEIHKQKKQAQCLLFMFMIQNFLHKSNWSCFLLIGHFQITSSLFLKVSHGAHPLISKETSIMCKSKSFSYEWLCTKPRSDRGAYKGILDRNGQLIHDLTY